MKTCGSCKEEKPFELFSKGGDKYGLHNWCKPCAKIKRAERYEAKKEEERAQNRRWHQENKPWLKQEKRDYINAWRRANSQRRVAERVNRRAILKGAGTFTTEEWLALCELYGNKCLSCGTLETTVDHVVPLSRGGSNTIDNLQPLCGSCNSSKGTKTIDYRPETA